MKYATLLVGTNNAHKAREIAEILHGTGVHVITPKELNLLEEPEENGTTFVENALIKARYYAGIAKMPCLADDSGLAVDALEGRPGVFSARYAPTDPERIARLLKEMEGVPAEKRTARFVCAMSLCTPDGSEVVETGTCEGEIAITASGSGGFGYDPIFYLPHLKHTMAELTADEKHNHSHRGNALNAMKRHLTLLFP